MAKLKQKKEPANKGDYIEFETNADNIHKLLFEEDDLAIEDEGRKVGILIKEILPIQPGKLKVIAQIAWVEEQ